MPEETRGDLAADATVNDQSSDTETLPPEPTAKDVLAALEAMRGDGRAEPPGT